MSTAEMCVKIRDKLGITQKQLAGLISTNQTEISFIERGFVPNNYQKVVAINRLYERLFERD